MRGTEGAIEINADLATTHMGLFEGNMAVSSLDLPHAQPILLHEGLQTHIGKNKVPAQPYPLKKIMLKHKKKMGKIRMRLATVRKNWHKLNKKRKQKIRRKLRRRTRKKKSK